MPLVGGPGPRGKNTGTATWTYNIADQALDFLAEGEKLVLNYIAEVDNNYPLNNETTFKPFTITITGTNDAPIIDSAAQSGSITETADLAPAADADPTDATGTITFDDVDLSDVPTAEHHGLECDGRHGVAERWLRRRRCWTTCP